MEPYIHLLSSYSFLIGCEMKTCSGHLTFIVLN
jgi:hypothetical protein